MKWVMCNQTQNQTIPMPSLSQHNTQYSSIQPNTSSSDILSTSACNMRNSSTSGFMVNADTWVWEIARDEYYVCLVVFKRHGNVS